MLTMLKTMKCDGLKNKKGKLVKDVFKKQEKLYT